MFVIDGFRLLIESVDEVLVLGVFSGVIDILVEVGINEFGIMGGDGLGSVKEVRLFNIGGFGLLVFWVFIVVIDILVEVGIDEFGITDGDRLSCVEGIRLFSIGGFGLFVEVVDETLCVGVINILGVFGDAECVIVINGGLIVSLDERDV